jgi:hypothetical protein
MQILRFPIGSFGEFARIFATFPSVFGLRKQTSAYELGARE